MLSYNPLKNDNILSGPDSDVNGEASRNEKYPELATLRERNSMRKILFALSFLSASAFACPQLGGLHVNCIQSDGSITKVRIVQSIMNGVVRYKMDWAGKRTAIHDADGITRATEIFDTGLTLKRMAVCEGDMLKHTALMTDSTGTVKLDVTEEYTIVNRKLHFRALDESGVYNQITCRAL